MGLDCGRGNPNVGLGLLTELFVWGNSCAYPAPVKIAEHNRTDTTTPKEAEQNIDPMFFYYRDIAI
jgi:hypothetical protein